MRINQIIHESNVLNDVQRQPFNELYPDLTLYHGSHKLNSDNIVKIPFKYRKEPQTTIKEFHDALNEVSEERFNIPIRNLLFCHPYSDDTFGKPYQIVPIGNCRMFYHPNINDLTVDLGYANYYVFDYDNNQFIKELTNQFPVKYMDELANEIFDGESVFHFDVSELQFIVNDIVSKYDDSIQLKATVQDNQDTILRMVEDSRYTIMLQHASKYIDGVEEVDSDNYQHIDDEEVMVYAPNGFYAIPTDESF